MKTNINITDIIFDFGGVILDIDPQLTINELVNLGIKDVDVFSSAAFQQGVVEKLERGIITPEVFRDKIREFAGKALKDQDIDDAWNALLLDIPKERIKAIEAAKQHYGIYLLSNSNEIHYELYVRDLQLRFGYREFDQLFDKAYFSFDLHMSKPNPEIFEFVIHQHRLNPANTLFIDDTLMHIEAAAALGLQTYHLQKPERLRDLFIEGKLREDLLLR
ncbi:MAG TPA: HAD family phosphatase [Bacteroidales bacterium]|nr:HAD family phosphatase [Bacteroidales bacterium]